jgi:HK97 family phage portal protein
VGEVAREDHPFLRLLDRPNPLMSRFELIEGTVGCLEIHGNAYWFLAGLPGGIPQELWPLRPDRVSIVPDARRGVRGYIYEVDGRQIPLDAAEVVHFRRWHPANDYYGLSALEAARLAVESDRAMADWNRRYFGEGMAVPAGIVAIRDRVSDADFERLKHEWRMAYGGRERKTAFLRGTSVEWHNVGLSQHDMDFLNARRFNREEIFQIFGVPVGMFSENATEANALVGERVFVERTLWPKLVRIAEKITTDLLPFYGANLAGRFDDIRPQDRSALLAEIRAARGLLSVNEMRARYFQLGPVPWGDGARSATPSPDENFPAAPRDSGTDAAPQQTGEPPAGLWLPDQGVPPTNPEAWMVPDRAAHRRPCFFAWKCLEWVSCANCEFHYYGTYERYFLAQELMICASDGLFSVSCWCLCWSRPWYTSSRRRPSRGKRLMSSSRVKTCFVSRCGMGQPGPSWPRRTGSPTRI